jgi:hypothetical protein
MSVATDARAELRGETVRYTAAGTPNVPCARPVAGAHGELDTRACAAHAALTAFDDCPQISPTLYPQLGAFFCARVRVSLNPSCWRIGTFVLGGSVTKPFYKN